MYFTLDDYRKIEQWLNKRGIKDTEFPDAVTLDNKDYIPVIQDERNKKLSVISFTRFLETMTGNLINVSSVFNKYGITLNEAINAIPVKSRRIGLIVTFLNEDNEWVMYQFNSDTLNDWLNEDKWSKSYENAFKFKGLFTSEEELTDKVRKPLVGDYAFVGESMEEAELWICEEKGVWKNTFTKAHRYADLFEAVHSKDFNDFNVSQFIYDNDGEDIQVDEQYSDRAEKDALGNIIHFTYINREGFSEYVLDKILETITKVTLPEGSIGLEQLNEALRQYIKSGGNVTNMADEEDLTVINEVLKFRDKKYEPVKFSGKGRKYLRKNMVDGVNVLEQYMLSEPNTIYIIQYDYCLNNNTISIPRNCVLRFEGGSLNGGTIVLDNTKIEGESFEIDVDVESIYSTRKVSHIISNSTFINIEFIGDYAVGQMLFHKSLKIPIWWNGESWITHDWMSMDSFKDVFDKIEEFDIAINKLNVFKEGASTSLSDIDDDLYVIKADIKNLDNIVDTLDGEIATNFANIKEVKKDVESISTTVEGLNKEVEHINTNIDNIIDGPIVDLSNRIEEVNGNVEEALDTKVDKVEGKQLSTNDFTNALKEKLEGLTNYNDAELSAKIDELKNALDVILDSENTTAVIDTWKEVENFLAGITNTETLTGLLADLKSEITQLCANTYAKVKSANDFISLSNEFTFVGNGYDKSIYINYKAERGTAEIKGYEFYNGSNTKTYAPLKASKYVVPNGTSSQFLKADGSVDGTAYLPKTNGTHSGNLNIETNSDGGINIKPIKPNGAQYVGFLYKDATDNAILGGIGLHVNSIKNEDDSYTNSVKGLTIGWGETPWTAANSLYINDNTFTYKNNKVWHAGNDGSGSGLDADMLDGKQPADLNVGSADKAKSLEAISTFISDLDAFSSTSAVGTWRSDTEHKPSNYGVVLSIVSTASGAPYKFQLGFNTTSYDTFLRRNINGTWTDWKKMLTEDDIVSTVASTEIAEISTDEIDNLAYGVEWKPDVSSPALTRIGNLEMHKSLPIQSKMRGCIYNAVTKEIVYYLKEDDWTKKEDGTAARLDGYDGEVGIHIPKFYIRSWDKSTIRRVMISEVPIDDSWECQEETVISAYKLTVLNTVPTDMGYLSSLPVNSAISIMNTGTYCRGGSNSSANDGLLNTERFRTMLGKPRTGLGRDTMRTYVRNGSKEILSYSEYKNILYWLYVIEYANFNSQLDMDDTLTSEGYRQGGLGNGLTTLTDEVFDKYMAYYPVAPCGYTNEFGNGTGEKELTVPAFTFNSSDVNNFGSYSLRSSGVTRSSDNLKLTITESPNTTSYIAYCTRRIHSGATVYNVQGLTSGQSLKFQLSDGTLIATASSNGDITVNWPASNSANRYIVGGFTGNCNIILTIKSATVTSISIASSSHKVNRWRGIEQLFGDNFTNVDGIIIDADATDRNNLDLVYITDSPDDYGQVITDKYRYIGSSPHTENYIKEWGLRDNAHIVPRSLQSSPTQYKCDRRYPGTANTTLRTLLFGGSAYHGAHAGVGCFYSGYSVSRGYASIAFRSSMKLS